LSIDPLKLLALPIASSAAFKWEASLRYEEDCLDLGGGDSLSVLTFHLLSRYSRPELFFLKVD
jgi:hypothetical protein